MILLLTRILQFIKSHIHTGLEYLCQNNMSFCHFSKWSTCKSVHTGSTIQRSDEPAGRNQAAEGISISALIQGAERRPADRLSAHHCSCAPMTVGKKSTGASPAMSRIGRGHLRARTSPRWTTDCVQPACRISRKPVCPETSKELQTAVK